LESKYHGLMKQLANNRLEDALDRYFANFNGTLDLAIKLITDRKNPIEVLILLCARLDALASDAAKDDMPSRKAFTSFVTAYAGHRDLLSSISVGDLYYELGYHRWLLEGMIPSPGRVHIFSRLDEPIIHLLDEAGLPVTLKDSDVLLGTLMRIIKREYRAIPGQHAGKRFVNATSLQNKIAERAKHTKLKKIANNLPHALAPLLERMKISSILYQRFRSESIHGATVILDEQRFFSEKEVYWKPVYSDYHGKYELVEFPARVLLSVLEQSIKTYRAALVGKGKIPPAVHFFAFPGNIFESLELLDTELLPDVGRIRLKPSH